MQLVLQVLMPFTNMLPSSLWIFGFLWNWLEHWEPGSFVLWDLPPYIALLQISSKYSFHSCMHGGSRDKSTTFLSNRNLSQLCLWRDGSHDHLAWGVNEDGSFATAEEAEYPMVLCDRLAQIWLDMATEMGFQQLDQLDDVSGKARADIAARIQPRRSIPPLIREFSQILEVPVPGGFVQLDPKSCLLHEFDGSPPGSKRLKTTVKRVGEGSDTVVFMLFGIYYTEDEFLNIARALDHPFDTFCDVPDCTLKLTCFMMTSGPVALMKHGLEVIEKWRGWLKMERELHRSLDSGGWCGECHFQKEHSAYGKDSNFVWMAGPKYSGRLVCGVWPSGYPGAFWCFCCWTESSVYVSVTIGWWMAWAVRWNRLFGIRSKRVSRAKIHGMLLSLRLRRRVVLFPIGGVTKIISLAWSSSMQLCWQDRIGAPLLVVVKSYIS